MENRTAAKRPLSPRGIAVASLVGTTIEWYDFYVFGIMAAIFFGPLFFPNQDPITGFLLSVATIGVAYLARPIGALIFSHYGDKFGRRNTLLISLLLMGAATFAVGLLPTYDSIGVWAPVLLVILRFIQGLSAGGEYGGAVLLAVEKAPPNRRAFYGAAPSAGVQLGSLTAAITILAVQQLPDDAFNSYGWRIPFLISIVPLAIGLLVRMRITETEEFVSAKGRVEPPKLPLLVVLREHWRVVIVSVGFIFFTHAGYIIFAFLPGYATNVLGMDAQWSTTGIIVGGVAGIVALAVIAWKVDGRDRRKFTGAGGLLVALYSFPAFFLVSQFGVVGFLIAMVVGFVLLSVHNAALPSLLADQYPVLVRYTGISLSYSLSAVIGAGLMPLLVSYWVNEAGSYWPAALFLTVGGLITVAGSYFAKRSAPAAPFAREADLEAVAVVTEP